MTDSPVCPAYLLDRVPLPKWVLDDTSQQARVLQELTGESAAWAAALPMAYRVMANPGGGERMLAPPQPGDPVQAGTAYWAPILPLLLCSLGWSRPDLGLRWWYDAGKPTDDPTLALLAAVWDADGRLDAFAAWLHTWGAELDAGAELNRLAGRPRSEARVASHPAWTHAARAAEQRGWHETDAPAPLSGGTDPLHLSAHCDAPLQPGGPSAQLLRDEASRQAVVVTDSIRGWYRLLHQVGSALTETRSHAWRVDVYVKPLGHLGTFRRSWSTGLWFSGRHAVHSRGN